jgi:hypothetical protein
MATIFAYVGPSECAVSPASWLLRDDEQLPRLSALVASIRYAFPIQAEYIRPGYRHGDDNGRPHRH